MKKLLLLLLCVPLIGFGQNTGLFVNWDSRIAYELSRKNSYKEYSNQELLIFSSLNDLYLYQDQGFLDSNNLIYNHRFYTFPDSNTYKLTEQSHFPLIKSVDKSIKVVGVVFNKGFADTLLFIPDPPRPPLGDCTNKIEESRDIINSSDLFKDSIVVFKGYLCVDCFGNGINELEPVILLTHKELMYLRESLRKMISNNGSLNEMKQGFEESLILIHKSILGQNISTTSIENLTFDEFWKSYFGINYFDPNFGGLKFKDISSIKRKHFLNFYNEFASQSEDFIETSFTHSDPYKNRRFAVARSYLYWIPLEDLPGCKLIE